MTGGEFCLSQVMFAFKTMNFVLKSDAFCIKIDELSQAVLMRTPRTR